MEDDLVSQTRKAYGLPAGCSKPSFLKHVNVDIDDVLSDVSDHSSLGVLSDHDSDETNPKHHGLALLKAIDAASPTIAPPSAVQLANLKQKQLPVDAWIAAMPGHGPVARQFRKSVKKKIVQMEKRATITAETTQRVLETIARSHNSRRLRRGERLHMHCAHQALLAGCEDTPKSLDGRRNDTLGFYLRRLTYRSPRASYASHGGRGCFSFICGATTRESRCAPVLGAYCAKLGGAERMGSAGGWSRRLASKGALRQPSSACVVTDCTLLAPRQNETERTTVVLYKRRGVAAASKQVEPYASSRYRGAAWPAG